MLPNPWILVGLLVFWLSTLAGAYWKGHTAAQDSARAQYATDLEATIAEHNANAEIDAQAALEWGQANARVRTEYVTIRSAANAATQNNPAVPACNLDTGRMQSLAAAISAANKQSPADLLLDATDKANSTSKPVR